MAVRLPEGWGQGPEWGSRPALAIDDSNAEFNFSACPIHLHQVSPGEQRTRKGQTSQGAGQRTQVFPRGKKESQPETRGGESRTDYRGSEMPEVSEYLQLDNQSGLPFVRLQTSPGECPQSTLPPEERWPGQSENWWGWIVLWCILGNLLCFRCQRRNRPGRDSERRKGHTAKEGRIPRETASHNGRRRSSPRGLRKPTGPAPSCPERPSQPRGETRFSHGQSAQSQSQGAEVRRTTPPGGSLFELCPCRRRRSQLRVESCTGERSPKTARTPPGGCCYDCPPRT